jgi:hypothetical protein
MNVWVDLINSLSFLPDFVSDPASNYLTHQPLLRVRGHHRERPERQQISHSQFVNISTIPNLSGSKFNQILV